jgi:hypothetical protein
VGLDLDLDAEIEGMGFLEAQGLADEVAPASPDDIEGVVEEVAAGPQDDESRGGLAGAERPRALPLAGLAGRREVHLDEADGALLGRGLDLLLKSPGGLGILREERGEVGQEQDDLALDVDGGVIVPAVLLGADPVADEDEPSARDTGAGAADGREVAAAAGEVDPMLRREDLEADGLLEVGPVLERDLLNQVPLSPPGLRPSFCISAATYSAARRYSGVPDLRPLRSLEARKAMWAKAFAPSAAGRREVFFLAAWPEAAEDMRTSDTARARRAANGARRREAIRVMGSSFV